MDCLLVPTFNWRSHTQNLDRYKRFISCLNQDDELAISK